MQEPLSRKIDSGKISLQPNKLSERILKCLICIFQRLLRTSRVAEQEKTSNNISRTSGSIFDAVNTNLKKGQQDPYGIFEIEESIRRDIGSYKNLVRFSRSSLEIKLLSTSFPLFNKLRYNSYWFKMNKWEMVRQEPVCTNRYQTKHNNCFCLMKLTYVVNVMSVSGTGSSTGTGTIPS